VLQGLHNVSNYLFNLVRTKRANPDIGEDVETFFERIPAVESLRLVVHNLHWNVRR
jgi:hypothetical protein